MKKISSFFIFFICSGLLLQAQTILNYNQSSGSVTLGCNEYKNLAFYIVNINIGQNKKVKIDYNISTEQNYDLVTFYSIDDSGNSMQLLKESGFVSGTVFSEFPTGKIQIVFTSDYSVCCYDGYTQYAGATVSYSADDRIAFDGPVSGHLSNGALQIQSDFGSMVLGAVRNPAPFMSSAATFSTDRPYFLFEQPLIIRGGMLGSCINENLYLRAGGISGISIVGGGVGIGTDNPQNALDVYGSVYLPSNNSYWIGSNSDSGNRLRMYHDGSSAYIDYLPNLYFRADGTTNALTLLQNGNVGIGTTTPQARFDIGNDTPNETKAILARLPEGGNTWLSVNNYDTQPANGKMFAIEHKFYNTVNNAINFHRGGGDKDGFITFDVYGGQRIAKFCYRGLDIYGILAAKQVIITETNWADFVFNDNYRLKPLQEVNEYIDANKRLPDIPSEQEVKETGVSVGDMQTKLLQKVEELTLYLIKQDKQIQDLQKEIEALKSKEKQ